MKKRLFALALTAAMALTLLAGCGGDTSSAGSVSGSETGSGSGGNTAAGQVYYLNFKPEQDAQWQELAELYTQETGVPVKVVTAASNTYETQLTSEMAKEDAPTMFQVNGPVGLNSWKDYCYDLSGSAIYGELTSEDYALKNGDEVAGIAYVIES